MKYKNVKNNKGFTLIETMFAVLILTSAIASMMSVVANSLFTARYARDETTVNYLLQEVVDFIRNDRDTTVFLDGSTGDINTIWNNFYLKYSNCTNNSRGCYFDVFGDNTPKLCSSGGCPYLYYNKDADTTPFYVSDNVGNPNFVQTSFRRKIVVVQNPLNPNEINVTVTIDWKNGGLDVSRSLESSFMKWQ
jgi:type II secretory pathway pseudopilin PulG